MNERKYSEQALAEYLLGSLPEGETEYFDELSFTDDEFADSLKSAENDLIDSYARGEMTGATLEKFKSYYLASPLRRERAEFAEAFQVFAEKNVAGTSEEVSISKPEQQQTAPGFFSLINIFTIPKLQWGLAFAALAFLLIGGWLFFENALVRNRIGESQAKRDEVLRREQKPQQQIEPERSTNSETEQELARTEEERKRLEQELEKEKAPEQRRATEQARVQKRAAEQQRAAEQRHRRVSAQQTTVASFVLLPPLRGAAGLPTLKVPPRAGSVRMQIEIESDDYPIYLIVLRSQIDNRTLWRSGRLKAKSGGENKRLNVGFPADLLKSQIYSLEVSGVLADGSVEIVGDYPFQIVR